MEKEIDLIEIFRKLLHRWRLIVLAGAIVGVVGVVVALVSPVEYTAGCVMVPQTGNKQSGGQMGGLAAMAGINLNSGQSGEILSPTAYPQIVRSVPFQKDLMRTKVHLKEYAEPVTLLDYFADTTKKKRKSVGTPAPVLNDSLERLSPREAAVRAALYKNVTLIADEKEDFITLSVIMPEAEAAAEVAEAAQALLQSYVTRFKIQKEQATLDFIEGRAAEAKKEYESAQDALAAVRDHNRNVITQTGQIELNRKMTEYNLAYGVYSSLLQQREQARIKVKETTPVFTVIEPVTVPNTRTAPQRTRMVIIFGLLGGLLGCVLALTLPAGTRTFRRFTRD